MTTTVVGVFGTDTAAQSAVNQLRDLGVPADQISVIARPSGEIVNEHGEVIDVPEDHMTAGEGVTVGAVWGGLVGLAALALPGIGPLVTSNVFSAFLTGAVAGAATGGIAGALIDAASVPEEHARVYENRIRSGSTLVTAQVNDSIATQARGIMHGSGAEEFDWNNPSTFEVDRDSDSAEENYAESSKVGTVGGGTAGAVTGAAIGAAGGPIGAVIGGVAGAAVGGSVGAVGDTVGEAATDSNMGEDHANRVNSADRGPTYTTQADADLNRLDEAGYVAGGMTSDRVTAYDPADRDTEPSYTAHTDRDDTTLRDEVHDAATDDHGDDTFSTADHAYDESSKAGTLGGAAAGAATGAAIGSVGGPIGTAAGAVTGAITGAAAGAIGDTIGEEADEEIGAFSPDNKEQYERTGDNLKNRAAGTWNKAEDKTNTDLDRDGDVGRRS